MYVCPALGPKFIFIKSHKMLVISDHNHSASLSIFFPLSLSRSSALPVFSFSARLFHYIFFLLDIVVSCSSSHPSLKFASFLHEFGAIEALLMNVYDMVELKLIKSAHKKPFTKLMSINNVKSRETH